MDSTGIHYGPREPGKNEAYKPLVLQPLQVFKIYVGLKQGEACQDKLNSCLGIAESLNGIIQQQNDSLQVAGLQVKQLNTELNAKQAELLNNAVKIQALEDKRTPWYRHPLTWSIIGLVSGILIVK